MNTVAPTGVEVRVAYNPFLSYHYAKFPAYVVINDVRIPAKWSAQFFPLEPGRYNVGCFARYLFWSKCGYDSVSLDIAYGQVVRIVWTAPFAAFLKGRMKVELIALPPLR